MATIPMGDFGQGIARPAPRPTFAAGDGGLGAATDRLARTAGAIVEDSRRADEDLRDKADAADTVLALHTGQSELKRKRDELTQAVMRGDLDKDKAGDRWQQDSQAFVDKWAQRLPRSRAQMAQAQLMGHALELSDGVRQAVERKNIEDVRAGLLGSLEALERDAVDPGQRELSVRNAVAAIEHLGPAAGYGSDDRQRLTQGFKERAAFNAGSALVRVARDDMGSLDGVLARIKSPEFADLDPGKLGQLEQQVLGRKQYLLHQQQAAAARAEAAAARRDRQAEQAFKAMQGLIDSGAVPDQAYLSQVQLQTQGTVFAPALTTLLHQASENASFAVLPPQKQQAALLALRARANAEGSNPQAEARIQHLERIAAKSADQLRDDPLVWGAQRRLIPPVTPMPNFVLGAGDIGSVQAQLAERVQQAEAIAAATGRPVSPLLASEAQAAAEKLAMLPITQREQALASLAQALPDPGMVRAMAQQIEPKDRSLALAMFAAGKRAPGGESPSLLILRGGEAVKTGRIQDSDEAARIARSDIARTLSEVPWATPQARDAAIDAAQRVWLGLRDEGRNNAAAAVKIATGGLTEWADSKVPLPYGMSESEFKRNMRGMTAPKLSLLAGADALGEAFTVNGRAISAQELAAGLPQMKLVPVDDGVYALQGAGGLVLSRGYPFRLRVGH